MNTWKALWTGKQTKPDTNKERSNCYEPEQTSLIRPSGINILLIFLPPLRFAQFFISPLFNADCKEREIRAVDSEFKRNLQQDSRRQFQLAKTLSNPNHPYWHFSTGNLTTLEGEPTQAGIDVREALIQFHAKYYSASIMRLAVLGREPLEQLVQWAVEKFSPVKNLEITPPAYPHGPLTANELLVSVFLSSLVTRHF